jgi:hypothetical protein
MKTVTPKITVDLIWPDDSPYRTAEIKLGKFKLSVHEGDEHLTENLYDGMCPVPIPAGVKHVFRKHKLYLLTKNSNPEIIKLLRKVFVDQDDSDFKGESLDLRTAEVVLKKDKTINSLLCDSSFIALNKGQKADRRSESKSG